MNIEIFYTDQSRSYKDKNGDLVLRDSTFLNDVYVKLNNNYYNINVHCFVNFIFEYKEVVRDALKFLEPIDKNKDFNCDEQIGFPANLVFSTGGMSKKSVIKALLSQDEYFFYGRLKPCKIVTDEILLELSPRVEAGYIEDGDSLSIPIKDLIKIYPD